MSVGRVVIFPCGGIKRPQATVARVASYMVNEELLLDQTMLMCVPAFLRGVPEDVFMIQRNPTLVIDCHEESCGSHLMHLMGLTPAARVFIPELFADRGLRAGTDRQELDQDGNHAARVVAEFAAQAARFMLEEPGYHFEPQEIAGYQPPLAQPGFDSHKAYNWRSAAPGLQIPQGMPDIRLETP